MTASAEGLGLVSRRIEAPPEPDKFPLPGAAPKIGSEAADGPQRERGR